MSRSPPQLSGIQFVKSGFAEGSSRSNSPHATDSTGTTNNNSLQGAPAHHQPQLLSPHSQQEQSPPKRALSVSFGQNFVVEADVMHSSPTSSAASSPQESSLKMLPDDEAFHNHHTRGGATGQPDEKNSDDDDADDGELMRRERAAQERSAAQAKSDPRLQDALRLVRKLSSAKLKEQCLVTEWTAAKTEVEREILLEAVADPAFWAEVKNMSLADVDAEVPDEDDDVDTESRLYQMFKCFDRDGLGTIGANELHQMLLYMGVSASEEEVEAMIRQFDADSDGRIAQAEFMLIMKRAQAGQLSIAAPTRQTIRRASFRVTQNRPVFPRTELRIEH